MSLLAAHSRVAFNTATASANKIHDDAVARHLGFQGGLVPGVDDHPVARTLHTAIYQPRGT